MIDHTGILVSDFDRSREFYARALAPLGYEILMELSEGELRLLVEDTRAELKKKKAAGS